MYDIPVVGTHSVQICRSVSRWSSGTFTEVSVLSAYISVIEKSKHFLYFENQFFVTSFSEEASQVFNQLGLALFRRILAAHKAGERFHIFVVLPLTPGFPGKIVDRDAVALRRVMEFQYRCLVKDDGTALLQRLDAAGIDYRLYISFHGLRTFGVLEGRYVTEEIYVHSKVLIADDAVAIVGSANINDRSFAGDRDTEVAVVISDAIKVKTRMNGETHYASKSVFELRCQLFEEHLGLQASAGLSSEDQLGHYHLVVEDPLCDKFLADVWLGQSAENTRIFREAFHPIPDDTITTLADLQTYQRLQNPPFAEQTKLLAGIRGTLTDFPLYYFSKFGLQEAVTISPDAFFPYDLFC